MENLAITLLRSQAPACLAHYHSLLKIMFSNTYQDCPVLITGHTGFKGSWLALWLTELGARVSGLSLSVPTTPSHWNLLKLNCHDERGDVRDFDTVKSAISRSKPRIIFHLAAQPLVRKSYSDPLETWSTNVIGTANVLEAARLSDCVKAIVVITTDKCYENKEQIWGYREHDRLGGHDPYSASKAATELVATSFRKSYCSSPNTLLIATARAGNVIGGGDWSEDRLIPDAVRAATTGEPLLIRAPNSTRPWQHVLEPLSGYLNLGKHLLDGKIETACAWNFGPHAEDNKTVSAVLDTIKETWPNLEWHSKPQPHLHETALLHLDSTKAKNLLKWKPVWTFKQAIQKTAAWYQVWHEDAAILSRRQLNEYCCDALRNR
jgi:CDP-glucose 4,6-dehydratase